MLRGLRRSRAAVLLSLLTLLALVAVPGTAAAEDGDRYGQDRPTIPKARAMPLNTVVTIEGTVTTPSGVFAIQDRTAVIFVSLPNTNSGVSPPRHVEVTGSLQNPSGLLMIVPARVKDVKVKGNDKPVQTWARRSTAGRSRSDSEWW